MMKLHSPTGRIGQGETNSGKIGRLVQFELLETACIRILKWLGGLVAVPPPAQPGRQVVVDHAEIGLRIGAIAARRSGSRCLGALLDLVRRGEKPGVLARAPVILPPSRGALISRERGDFLAGSAACVFGEAGIRGVAHGK
jgi:hypothetical protein